ncbi:MAG: Tfp pilus assembly protein PilF [Rhodospirillaceae bacterium]|nr:MAG: Tfp pilus assembly protein PilF [Rhodospirillaceae bacterium]
MQLYTSFAWWVNLGHLHLLKKDATAARAAYERGLSLIIQEEAFQSGPMADFALLIEKGWEPQAARRERAWMEQAWAKVRPSRERWASLNAAGVQQYGAARHAEAETANQEALELAETTFSAEHFYTTISLGNLADVYVKQNRPAEAEPLYKRSLAIKEKVLGPEHPDLAADIRQRLMQLIPQERWAEAEPLLKQMLAIWEKQHGPDSIAVATSAGDLGQLYMRWNKPGEAEPWLLKALALQEKNLGADHAKLLPTLENLKAVYEAGQQEAKARAVAARIATLKGAEKPPQPTAVPQDPALAEALALNDQVVVLYKQGQYAEAISLARRSLALREKILGTEHPDVAQSLNNLAELYRVQGLYPQAEPLSKRSLAIKEKTLGPEHLGVAISLNNLAALYRAQGFYPQAEPLYKRSLAIREKALGPEHPDVAGSLNNLALLYNNQNRQDDALTHIRRATAMHRARAARAGEDRGKGAHTELRQQEDLFLFHVPLPRSPSRRDGATAPAPRGRGPTLGSVRGGAAGARQRHGEGGGRHGGAFRRRQ